MVCPCTTARGGTLACSAASRRAAGAGTRPHAGDGRGRGLDEPHELPHQPQDGLQRPEQRHSLPRLPSPLARRGPAVLRLELLQPPRALERARAHRARLARRGIGVEDRLTAASLAQAGYFLLAAALLLVALLPVKHLALAAAVELLSAGAAAA